MDVSFKLWNSLHLYLFKVEQFVSLNQLSVNFYKFRLGANLINLPYNSKGIRQNRAPFTHMHIQATDIEYGGNYTLICTFNDGAVKNVDLSPNLDAPTFRELKDVDKFRQFGLDETIFFDQPCRYCSGMALWQWGRDLSMITKVWGRPPGYQPDSRHPYNEVSLCAA